MRRRIWTIAIGLTAATVGCSKGTDPALTGLGPEPWTLPGDTDDDPQSPPTGGETGSDGGDTTGAADSGAPQTGSGGESTDGPVNPGTTGGGEEGEGTFGGGMGEQPDSGWWAHCLPNTSACDAGLTCLSTDVGDDGVCTSQCAPVGDPGACGDSPGGTNVPVCLTVGGNSICALGCDGGLTCPSGMVCHTDSDDNGPIAICI